MSAQFGDSQQNPQSQVLSGQPANMTGAQSLQQQTGVLLQQNQQSTNPGQVNYQPPSTPGQQNLGQKQQGSLPRPQQHAQYMQSMQNQQFASQSPSMQGAQPTARPSISTSAALSQRALQVSQTGIRSGPSSIGGPTSQQQMMMPQTGIRTQTMISSQQQQRVLQVGQATQQTQHHPSLQTAQMAASQNQALHQQFSSSARPLYSQAEQSFGVQYPYHYQQTQQVGNTLSRTGLVGQASGHPSILSPQASQQLSGLQSQIQARQKQGQAQNAQLQTSNASGQSMQGPQTVGMMGLPAVGGQLMRPTAPLAQQQQQQRMQHSSLRPQQHAILQQPSRISPQVQQLTRVSSVGCQVPSLSPSSQSVTAGGSMLHHQQQWMQKQAQPLSSTQHLTQAQLQVQQRHILSQHPQQIQPQQQQLQNQTQNSQLQQVSRVQHSIVQRPPTPSGGALVSGIPTSFTGASSQIPELGTRILGKRSIQELVGQVDPNVRLDTDVEDILLDIADDFIESVTTFACKLAKHRKSNVLEAKDILLHLSKNWDITIPGFGNDELRTYKRSLIDETHKQRIALIRKSSASQKIGQDVGAGKGSGLAATGIAVSDAPADA